MGKAFALYSMAIAAEPIDQAKLQEAYALYKKVLENNYEHDAMRMAGIIAARLGLNEESRKYFMQFLELNPGDVSVRLQIASEQAKAGDHEGALKVVEEGLKTDSVSVDLLTWAGVFAAQAASRKNDGPKPEGQMLTAEAKTLFETAAKYYKRLFDLKNGDVEATIVPQMIQTLVLLERYPEAADIGRRAAQNPKTATGATLSALAQALAASGNAQEAVTVIDQAIAKNDTSITGLRGRKAEILLRNGDLAGAKAAFQDAVNARELPTDSAANKYWIVAIQDKWGKKDYEATITLMDAGKDFAQDAVIKAKLSWFAGLGYYYRGRDVNVDPNKVATARTALPLYTRALNLLEEGAPYARENANMNYAQTVGSIKQYIDYLNELIKRAK
jgi:tetratricopeptide (TPR) repeat protein